MEEYRSATSTSICNLLEFTTLKAGLPGEVNSPSLITISSSLPLTGATISYLSNCASEAASFLPNEAY